MHVHPFYMGNPAAIGCSWCFMLPGGTPANAIAAGYANIRTIDMVISLYDLRCARYDFIDFLGERRVRS